MDLDIHYPYGIPFYADIKMIRVYFMNNDQDFFCIYFVKNDKVDKLAGIVFAGDKKKKYHFPEKSKIVIIVQSKPHEIYREIYLQDNMIYIYP